MSDMAFFSVLFILLFFFTVYSIYLLDSIKKHAPFKTYKPEAKINSVQEDQRAIESRKRVKKAFEEQWEQINQRAIRPHGPHCKDPMTCNKPHCWKWEPDKIVSDEYEVEK